MGSDPLAIAVRSVAFAAVIAAVIVLPAPGRAAPARAGPTRRGELEKCLGVLGLRPGQGFLPGRPPSC